MKKNFTLPSVLVLLVAACTTAKSDIIAQWTFETSIPTTAGPHASEVGSGSATGFHVGAAVYSNPVGNGSGESFSANTWAVGDYYQFEVSSVGFSDITVSFDQVSSSTGPGEFNFEYSTDGGGFTQFGSTYTVLVNTGVNTWSSGIPIFTTSFSFDLSSITALNNDSTIYFRLTDASTTSASGGTVAATGTDRVDNFTVSGTPVPEPSSIVLASLGGLLLLAAVRRRR